MKLKILIPLLVILLTGTNLFSQDEFLYSSDGKVILRQRELIQNCLNNLQKTKSDPTATAICSCQADILNFAFTSKQIKQHTKNGVIDLNSLIKEDSAISKKIENCYKESGKLALISAERDETKFVQNCVASIQSNTNRKLDTNKLKSFCTCQLELIKTKKINDLQLETLKNPNSLLFYEMFYKCGNPFVRQGEEIRNWDNNSKNEIRGPDVDTVNILNLNGMTYLKLKIGSSVEIWLFDTGASDFLITTELEKTLREEKIINDSNFLGVGEYELANGAIDSCRRYRINDVKIGHYSVDNIIIAVSEKSKKIIAGKTLFNKFAYWALNNEQNKLILRK